MELGAADFSLSEYVERELEQLIGKSTGTSIASLEALVEQLAARQERMEQLAANPPSADAKRDLPGFDQDAFQLNPLFAKHETLLACLREKRNALYEEIRQVRGVKAAVDRILKEKESVLRDIFVLDFVRDLKLGNDVYALRLGTMAMKMQFGRSAREIENHVSVYKKESLGRFLQVKEALRREFAEQLRLELREERYEHTAQILAYFAEEKLREEGFAAVFEKFVSAADLAAFPTAFDRKYVDDVRQIFANFVGTLTAFFESREYLRSGFFLLIDALYLDQFCAYVFEHKLSLLLERVLGANLKLNQHFFLSYLEGVHLALQGLGPAVEALRGFSPDLHEHFLSLKGMLVEPYYEEYFPAELKLFGFAAATFRNYAASKVAAPREVLFEELRKMLGVSLPEHVEAVSAMLARCALLSSFTFSQSNVNTLLQRALSEFQAICETLSEGIARVLPPVTEAQTPVPPGVFELIAQLYAALLVAHLRVKAAMPQLIGSNYFSESENARKIAFDRVQSLINGLVAKTVDGVLHRATLIAENLLQRSKEKICLLSVLLKCVEGYLAEANRISTAEIKAVIESVFYRELINLIENALLTDKQRRKRLDFSDELNAFFVLFAEAKSPELQGDVVALKALLLTLREGKKSVEDFVGASEREHVSRERLERYAKQLI